MREKIALAHCSLPNDATSACAYLYIYVDYAMGENEKCSWDDGKQLLNIENHGYDFADLEEVFDGRFVVTRQDNRVDYGELRYNMLAEYKGRIINVTLTTRADRFHLISARPASREERKAYHEKKEC